MKVIVGLGNPGYKYQNNRHNVGQMFVDYLSQAHPELVWGSDKKSPNQFKEPTLPNIPNNAKLAPRHDKAKIRFVKTTVFMNQSGSEIKKLLKIANSKIENLIVAHDDLDIPLGKYKINKGQGPRLHNGINSIEEQLGTQDFWRLRIGIDNRTKDDWIDGETYVLQDFSAEEREKVYKIFPTISQRLTNIIES